MDVTNKLLTQQVSSKLITTQVLLFKAMLEDTRFKEDALQIDYQYLCKQHYNNVDKVFKNKSNIKVINLKNVHHGNILEQEELLVQGILSWCSDFAT